METLLGEGDISRPRTGIEVFPRIIQSPSEIEPDVHPRQIFRDMPEYPPEPPPSYDRVRQISKQARDTAINKTIPYRKGKPTGETR